MFNIEYHEGYYAVGNNIPFDENKSKDWKEGWNDGWHALYGDDDYYIIQKVKNEESTCSDK